MLKSSRLFQSLRRMSTSSTHYKDAGKLLNPKTTIAKITSEKLLDNKDARFLNLEKLEYISPIGKTGIWEMARRTTRPKDSQVDAVIIVPILNFTNGNKKLVFVRQFRPPTNGIVVEFPAGLVDPNDSIESCAIRELKEETGFCGVIRKKSGIVWSDPGLSDASCCVVWIDVDMSLEENQNPVPQWMDSEVIEVVEVDLDNVENTVDNWISQGYLIDAKVQTLLVGMSLSL